VAVSEAKRCFRCDLPITIDAENCVGCMTCVLRCALKYGNAFSPARSKVKITLINEDVNIITYTDDCDTCGICARYCPHDALYRGERRPSEVKAK
jgi:ferredoxin